MTAQLIEPIIGLELQLHERETISSILGALNIPTDTQFFSNNDGFSRKAYARALLEDSVLHIETNEKHQGEFSITVINLQNVLGRTKQVTIHGQITGEQLLLRSSGALVHLYTGPAKQHAMIEIDPQKELGKEPLKVLYAPDDWFPLPYELQGLCNNDAIDRLLALSRRILHTGL